MPAQRNSKVKNAGGISNLCLPRQSKKSQLNLRLNPFPRVIHSINIILNPNANFRHSIQVKCTTNSPLNSIVADSTQTKVNRKPRRMGEAGQD